MTSAMKPLAITELLGDGIGSELRESVHAVASSLPIEVAFEPFNTQLGIKDRVLQLPDKCFV